MDEHEGGCRTAFRLAPASNALFLPTSRRGTSPHATMNLHGTSRRGTNRRMMNLYTMNPRGTNHCGTSRRRMILHGMMPHAMNFHGRLCSLHAHSQRNDARRNSLDIGGHPRGSPGRGSRSSSHKRGGSRPSNRRNRDHSRCSRGRSSRSRARYSRCNRSASSRHHRHSRRPRSRSGSARSRRLLQKEGFASFSWDGMRGFALPATNQVTVW